MAELEQLGIRVVSGRLGRKSDGEGDDGDTGPPNLGSRDTQGPALKKSGMMGVEENAPSLMAGLGAAGWGNDELQNLMMARRNSALGMSRLDHGFPRGSLGIGSLVGLDGDPVMPPHRPLVGGGAAAAFEASRHDHYTQKSAEQLAQRASLGLGGLSAGMPVNSNQ
jgi:hypothetical protein